ncbi:hypothetical protein TWF281_001577 [Arthrobotrys megalospora]
MYFGKAVSGESVRVADMTVKNKDNPLILLENFDDLTESIVCTKGDQEITLKFKTKDGMNAAIAAWDWVNDNETDYFTLITHHHHTGCGPDEERTPYKITDVDYDEANLKAVLTKQPASWDETLRTFEMSIDTIDHPMRKRTLDKRFINLFAPFQSISHFICQGAQWCEIPMNIAITPLPVRVAQFTGERIESNVALIKDGYDLLLGDGIDKNLEVNWGNSNPDSKMAFTELFKAPAGIDIAGKVTCTGCYLKGSVKLNAKVSRKEGDVMPSVIANFASNLKGKVALELSGSIGKELDLNVGALVVNSLMASEGIDKVVKMVPEVAVGPGLILKGEISTSMTLPTYEIDLPDFNFQLDLGIARDPSFELPEFPENAFKKTSDLKWNGIDWDFEANMYFRLGYGLGVEFLGKDGPIPLGLNPGSKIGAFAGFEPRIENALKGQRCGPEAEDKSVMTVINTDLITVTSDFKLNLRIRPMLELELGNWFNNGFMNGQIEQGIKDFLGGVFDGCTLGAKKLGRIELRNVCSQAPMFSGIEDFKWTEWSELKTCMGLLGKLFMPNEVPSWYPGSKQ